MMRLLKGEVERPLPLDFSRRSEWSKKEILQYEEYMANEESVFVAGGIGVWVAAMVAMVARMAGWL